MDSIINDNAVHRLYFSMLLYVQNKKREKKKEKVLAL